MNCPRDQAQLTVRETEGHIGYVCPVCHGAWLPSKYLRSLELTRQFSYVPFVRSLANAPVQVSSLVCPFDCGNLSKVSWLETRLAWCKVCDGVWFDPGEIRALLARVKPLEPTPGVVVATDVAVQTIAAVLLGFLS